MNALFWIILIALISEFVIGALSTMLNMRSLDASPPPGLETMYDNQDYRKSQEYTRVQSRFGLIVSALKLAMLLTFWFVGGFNYIDQLIRVMEWNGIGNGIAFIGILTMLFMILNLPAELYATFVIEERFGFNTTTYSTFALDTLKSVCLSIVLGVPLLVGILLFPSS